jgi:hypothetical protein
MGRRQPSMQRPPHSTAPDHYHHHRACDQACRHLLFCDLRTNGRSRHPTQRPDTPLPPSNPTIESQQIRKSSPGVRQQHQKRTLGHRSRAGTTHDQQVQRHADTYQPIFPENRGRNDTPVRSVIWISNTLDTSSWKIVNVPDTNDLTAIQLKGDSPYSTSKTTATTPTPKLPSTPSLGITLI